MYGRPGLRLAVVAQRGGFAGKGKSMISDIAKLAQVYPDIPPKYADLDRDEVIALLKHGLRTDAYADWQINLVQGILRRLEHAPNALGAKPSEGQISLLDGAYTYGRESLLALAWKSLIDTYPMASRRPGA
jgi:hypothetical protein